MPADLDALIVPRKQLCCGRHSGQELWYRRSLDGKFWDVVGLYLDPPEMSLVLCCDEKTQCQALERTQPGLPLGHGQFRPRTHGYIRHGTVTLFAALSYHRGTPDDVDLHLIADNYCTHKHGKVVSWLKKHQRFHMHFIPTSISWMNMVERFFADLTQDCVRAGSFTSVAIQLSGGTLANSVRVCSPASRRVASLRPRFRGADGPDAGSAHARSRLALADDAHSYCCGRRPVQDDTLSGDR